MEGRLGFSLIHPLEQIQRSGLSPIRQGLTGKNRCLCWRGCNYYIDTHHSPAAYRNNNTPVLLPRHHSPIGHSYDRKSIHRSAHYRTAGYPVETKLLWRLELIPNGRILDSVNIFERSALTFGKIRLRQLRVLESARTRSHRIRPNPKRQSVGGGRLLHQGLECCTHRVVSAVPLRAILA